MDAVAASRRLPAFGQAAIAPASPTITILSASTGAMMRSEGPGNASLDLGKVSYFKGASAPGESSQKTPRALVISTRFGLRIDCPGSMPASRVNVTMSRTDAASTHSMAIDGIKLGTAPRPLIESMTCGSTQRAPVGTRGSGFHSGRTHRKHRRVRGNAPQVIP